VKPNSIDRREFSFWRAVGRLRFSQVFGIESIAALVIGGVGAALAGVYTTSAERIASAGDFQALSGALTGVVFAGFALVVGLLSNRYAIWLNQTPDGIGSFVGPFLIGVGVQIASLLVAVAYRLAAKALPNPWEQIAFGVTAVVFVYAALDVVVLAKTVFAHAKTKAEFEDLDQLERRANELRQQKRLNSRTDRGS
jgi:hypothetical protein